MAYQVRQTRLRRHNPKRKSLRSIWRKLEWSTNLPEYWWVSTRSRISRTTQWSSSSIMQLRKEKPGIACRPWRRQTQDRVRKGKGRQREIEEATWGLEEGGMQYVMQLENLKPEQSWGIDSSHIQSLKIQGRIINPRWAPSPRLPSCLLQDSSLDLQSGCFYSPCHILRLWICSGRTSSAAYNCLGQVLHINKTYLGCSSKESSELSAETSWRVNF